MFLRLWEKFKTTLVLCDTVICDETDDTRTQDFSCT